MKQYLFNHHVLPKKLLPMKQHSSLFIYAIILAFFSSSCANNKHLLLVKNSVPITSQKNVGQCYVKRTDGSVQYFKSLKLVKGLFKSPHLLADDKIVINASEITAYQNNQHYAVSQNQIIGGKKSFVAVETLPGFAVRLVRGKLNLYRKKYYNGHGSSDEYFIQSGDEGNIIVYNPDSFKGMINDNEIAMSYISEENEKKDLSTYLETVTEIYNITQYVSKN